LDFHVILTISRGFGRHQVSCSGGKVAAAFPTIRDTSMTLGTVVFRDTFFRKVFWSPTWSPGSQKRSCYSDRRGKSSDLARYVGTCDICDHSRIVTLVDLSPEVEDFVKAWVACSLREVQSQCAGPWVHSALTMNSIGFTEGKDFGKTYGKYQPLWISSMLRQLTTGASSSVRVPRKVATPLVKDHNLNMVDIPC
jgi:hypothetical protein